MKGSASARHALVLETEARVRAIAEAGGGRIGFHGNYPTGSRFTLSIPG